MTRDWRAWLPDVALGSVILALGLLEAANTDLFDVAGQSRTTLVGVALVTAAAVACSRREPGLALSLVWATSAVQVLTGSPIMLVQLAFAVVAFGTARWGRSSTVIAAGLSIPTAGLIAALLVVSSSYAPFIDSDSYRSLVDTAYRFGDTWQVGAAVMGMGVLAVPFLAGLALRFSERARHSEVSQVAAEEEAAQAVRETEQAREIARLREEQARLARDVHDVVGHSLAVILAQAESAQYVDDVDTEKLKATMATIATSARSSLQDVRQVLTPSSAGGAPAAGSGGLDDLVAGVRASGHEVVSSVVGTPQPLPPELEQVAFRVLQEMLTNAMKHGQRGEPVFVERHWPDGSWVGELRIEVRNVVAPTADQPTEAVQVAGGQGLDGMRRRLETAGGRLDVRRRALADDDTFTVTAWVPVRAVGR
ncbi:histidine kinase [Nocardioides sp.]|uniref:sensor histidine kinase n=1 Tax=Nocardioides sp. TaxID=35761 RepID=UPI00286D3E42|nr:histidine kinase [Nocardioides sp.]